MTARLALILLMLGVSACSHRAPGSVDAAGPLAEMRPVAAEPTPKANPYEGVLDFSGRYQTFQGKPPRQLEPGVSWGCDFFVGKNSVDWTLAQYGNRVVGFFRANPIMLSDSWGKEEQFEGYVLKGRLHLNGKALGPSPLWENEDIVHYELELDSRGYLVGERNEEMFTAAPCSLLIGKPHTISQLAADGKGRNNHMYEMRNRR